MTPTQLAEIEARVAPALEYTWSEEKLYYLLRHGRKRNGYWDEIDGDMPEEFFADFLVNANKDIPALIAEVKRLRALTKEVINEAEHGWSYASEYFRGKYEVEKTIAGLRAALDI